MKIETIELTPEEMLAAVKMYLQSRGLFVDVSKVDSRGYPLKAWEVTANPQEYNLPVIPPIETELMKVEGE